MLFFAYENGNFSIIINLHLKIYMLKYLQYGIFQDGERENTIKKI